jgi:hypothetical protein
MSRYHALAALPLAAFLATSVSATLPMELDTLFVPRIAGELEPEDALPPMRENADSPVPRMEMRPQRLVQRYKPARPGAPGIDLWEVTLELRRPDGTPFGSPRERPEGSLGYPYAPDLVSLGGGVGPTIARPDEAGRVRAFVPLQMTHGQSTGQVLALLDLTSDEERPRCVCVPLSGFPIGGWGTWQPKVPVLVGGQGSGTVEIIQGADGAYRLIGSADGLALAGEVTGFPGGVEYEDRSLGLVYLDSPPPASGVTVILRTEDGFVLGTVSAAAGEESWGEGIVRMPPGGYPTTIHVQTLSHQLDGFRNPVEHPVKRPGDFLDGAAPSALYGLGLEGLQSAGYLPVQGLGSMGYLPTQGVDSVSYLPNSIGD